MSAPSSPGAFPSTFPFHLCLIVSFLPCNFRPYLLVAPFTFRNHGDASASLHGTVASGLSASPSGSSLHISLSFLFYCSPRSLGRGSPRCPASSSKNLSTLLPCHMSWKASTSQQTHCLERHSNAEFALDPPNLCTILTLSLSPSHFVSIYFFCTSCKASFALLLL